MNLKTGRLSWIIQMGPTEPNETLKAEDFLKLQSERGGGREGVK